MAHIRQQIRDYIIGLLSQEGLTVNTISPYRQDVDMGTSDRLVLVSVPAESIEGEHPDVVKQSRWVRSVEINIEGYSKADNELNDLDDLSVIIERAMATDLTLGGIAEEDATLSEITIEQSPSETTLASILMVYTAKVRTAANQPEKAL